jgi:hypothetical protein
MKKILPSYPRRRALLAAPFLPLDDAEFHELVARRIAIPFQRGGDLGVAKWQMDRGSTPIGSSRPWRPADPVW